MPRLAITTSRTLAEKQSFFNCTFDGNRNGWDIWHGMTHMHRTHRHTKAQAGHTQAQTNNSSFDENMTNMYRLNGKKKKKGLHFLSFLSPSTYTHPSCFTKQTVASPRQCASHLCLRVPFSCANSARRECQPFNNQLASTPALLMVIAQLLAVTKTSCLKVGRCF